VQRVLVAGSADDGCLALLTRPPQMIALGIIVLLVRGERLVVDTINVAKLIVRVVGTLARRCSAANARRLARRCWR